MHTGIPFLHKKVKPQYFLLHMCYKQLHSILKLCHKNNFFHKIFSVENRYLLACPAEKRFLSGWPVSYGSGRPGFLHARLRLISVSWNFIILVNKTEILEPTALQLHKFVKCSVLHKKLLEWDIFGAKNISWKKKEHWAVISRPSAIAF